MGAYPKCIQLFEQIHRDFKYEKETNEYKVRRLQSLSAIRWTTRVKAVNIIFDKFVELRSTLETLKKDPSVTADTKATIQGILKRQLSSLEVLFNLNVTRKLIALLEKFSKELQSVEISTDYALYFLKHTIHRMHEMGTDKEFERIRLRETKSIPGVQENSSYARQRKVPRWMEVGDCIATEQIQIAGTTNSTTTNQMRRPYTRL